MDQGVDIAFGRFDDNRARFASVTPDFFKLDSGNLQITESLELTKGAFMVQGRSTISAGNSISFGDGIPANNCNIRIGSQLEVTGNLINNNV